MMLIKSFTNERDAQVSTRMVAYWQEQGRPLSKSKSLAGLRTTLAEKATPDWVIQPQVGHVDPQMIKTYSHIRRHALIAATALEPNPDANPKAIAIAATTHLIG